MVVVCGKHTYMKPCAPAVFLSYISPWTILTWTCLLGCCSRDGPSSANLHKFIKHLLSDCSLDVARVLCVVAHHNPDFREEVYKYSCCCTNQTVALKLGSYCRCSVAFCYTTRKLKMPYASYLHSAGFGNFPIQ